MAAELALPQSHGATPVGGRRFGDGEGGASGPVVERPVTFMSLGDDVSLDAKEAVQEGFDALRGALRELSADATVCRRRRRARLVKCLGEVAMLITF